MSLPPELERQLEQTYNIQQLAPIVRFYDHAVKDAAKSEECGRERFKPAIYIEKVCRQSTMREVFARKMTESDKQEFPREWAQYVERHDAFFNRRPPLEAIPGLDPVSHAELKALNLTDCEKVAQYPGDLFELEHFRITAKKIMELSDELRSNPVREQRPDNGTQRQEVSTGVLRPVHSAGIFDTSVGDFRETSTGFNGGAIVRAAKENETFRYEVKVA